MGEARVRREAPLISVLIPERGRPEMLARLINSLLDTAGDDSRIEILVSIDNDDEAWLERIPPDHRHTRYFCRDRPITLGDKLNILAHEARGDILWFIANDYVMETPGWPQKFRDAVAKLPNGIGFPFPHDDLHIDHASFPVISRRTYKALGFLFPPPYPYWFIDTHMDALGIILGQRFEIDVTVRAPEGRGKTHGLIDLPFWVEFYNALAPMRLREAIQLMATAYGEGTPEFGQAMGDIGRRQQICAARTAHLSDPAFLAQWGDTSASVPAPRYAEAKELAVQMMTDLKRDAPRQLKVAIATPSGRTYEATTANCIAALAAHSTIAGVTVGLLNVQTSSISMGRNSIVEIAMQQGFDLILWIDSDMKFEPSVLLDLLKHQKRIVGATYNKRTPPHTTLGRLKGPMPPAEQLRGGLHEAEVLPGGLMLVHMDVYRHLPRPWYFESNLWDGDDGMAGFKAMLRDYFTLVPPPEVLSDLDSSVFGKWMAANYGVGLDAGSGEKLRSEDVNFCVKAMRAGESIWCCLDTTFRTVHIGVSEISCDRPPPAAQNGVGQMTPGVMEVAAD